MEQFGSKKVELDIGDEELENKLYKSLKDIGWIRVVNGLMIGIIDTYTGIS
tara:strand:- start:85 stop:237 length:153 start_codon:yes stop_codon:yes gene_type:complete